eukprot:TRINITY_DN21405_c0_g1_i1.p1 TRINITY_DN21405_c0_g1~~TRINITY_DN21405_c0_g1_i1.p1  ORF type:complete len:182 (+),score=54.80 TRINITY_DN21405_c0_g1_i1:41-586(+)
MISIKRLQYEEIPQLLELAKRLYSDTFAKYNTESDMALFFSENYTLQKFESEYSEPLSEIYVAICQDGRNEGKGKPNMIGYMRLRVNHEVADELGRNTLEIQRIYVDKEYHGRKVGELLLEKAFQVAEERKVDWIWLGVWEKNDRACRFYTKFGFEKFSSHVFQLGEDAQTDWLLKRRCKL